MVVVRGMMTTHTLQPSLKGGSVVVETTKLGVEDATTIGEGSIAVTQGVPRVATVEAMARIFDKCRMPILS